MGVAIPEKFLDLLADSKKAFANLATVLPSGSPQVTPIWFDFTNGKIRINTARGRVKDKAMTANAKVALSIMDPANPYRYIQIRGKVTRVTEAGAVAHIDSLAKKYMGVDEYPYHHDGVVRVTYEIEPESAQAMG
ncbi:MAG TPA: PPOX class F420-dependent oxidoreductase [Candidatus Binataceae bacterium]